MRRHTTTTLSSFLVRTPASASQTGEGIVGLHDPIRFAYIDLLGRWSSTGVGVVLVLVLVLSSLSLFSAKQIKISGFR